MKLEELFSKVLDIPTTIINDQFGQENSSSWTSLTHINLIATMEETYQISFSTREIRNMKTFADARAMLNNKGVAV